MVRKLKIWPAETQVCSGNNISFINTEGKETLQKNQVVTQNLLEINGTDLTDFRFRSQLCTQFSAMLFVFSFFRHLNGLYWSCCKRQNLGFPHCGLLKISTIALHEQNSLHLALLLDRAETYFCLESLSKDLSRGVRRGTFLLGSSPFRRKEEL